MAYEAYKVGVVCAEQPGGDYDEVFFKWAGADEDFYGLRGDEAARLYRTLRPGATAGADAVEVWESDRREAEESGGAAALSPDEPVFVFCDGGVFRAFREGQVPLMRYRLTYTVYREVEVETAYDLGSDGGWDAWLHDQAEQALARQAVCDGIAEQAAHDFEDYGTGDPGEIYQRFDDGDVEYMGPAEPSEER